ncbi:MAG: 4-hydroxy-tetrahydrodipicolinate reductase [Calditrichaeota bacterium]|nr:4-hydroxy-tetrahydrodipicolinate reductase [Calditrichota bacterium]MCB9365730.1 4-hydroxy-tetrahydrodipicolinate reductase [Calditrichota bacterium]
MSHDGKQIRAALFGAAGRMGRVILHETRQGGRIRITNAYDPAGAGQYFDDLLIQPSCHGVQDHVAVAIDFSLASAVAENVSCCRSAKVNYVCGVTALSEATHAALRDAAQDIAVLWAPNMSPGMNVLFALVAEATAALPEYSAYLTESHHIRKLDAPSGTAVRIAEIVQDTVGRKPEVYSLRMGDVVGEHTLVLGGHGERLEITHRADSRAVFAHGALRAAEWLAGQPAGFYSMADVLGL